MHAFKDWYDGESEKIQTFWVNEAKALKQVAEQIGGLLSDDVECTRQDGMETLSQV
jgi:hypothetical protein